MNVKKQTKAVVCRSRLCFSPSGYAWARQGLGFSFLPFFGVPGFFLGLSYSGLGFKIAGLRGSKGCLGVLGFEGGGFRGSEAPSLYLALPHPLCLPLHHLPISLRCDVSPPCLKSTVYGYQRPDHVEYGAMSMHIHVLS